MSQFSLSRFYFNVDAKNVEYVIVKVANCFTIYWIFINCELFPQCQILIQQDKLLYTCQRMSAEMSTDSPLSLLTCKMGIAFLKFG